MGTYNIPRDTKGEGRILYIFSTKALIYTGIGAIIGGVFYFILKMINLGNIGFFLIIIFGLIGFSIATFKIPKIKSVKALEDVGGENIDEIIKRYFKFRTKKKKFYSAFIEEDK